MHLSSHKCIRARERATSFRVSVVFKEQPIVRKRPLNITRLHLQASSSSSKTTSTPGPTTAPSNVNNNDQVIIRYRTGWKRCKLHYQVDDSPWCNMHMTNLVASRHRYKEARITLPSTFSKIQFVTTDGNALWDNNGAKNYTLTSSGNYVLRDGVVLKVERPPYLVVSDLDGTLVGDDNALEAFRDYWEQQAVARGCKLVYSSGRHLELFQALQKRLDGTLPLPDLYIGAVGTKIYTYKKEIQEHEDSSSGVIMVEDEGWTRRLDAQWSVHVVDKAVAALLTKLGADHAHLRPAEEQNAHKRTLGLKASLVEDARRVLDPILSAGGCRAKVIVSGTGDWRYMDIVSNGAGKHEALEYVRELYGFAHDQTVACGDSGNDSLMLSGECRAIVVGNAQSDLRTWAEEERAKGDGRVHIADRGMASGVLEGLIKFDLY